MISSSEIVARAMGLDPIGSPAKEFARCAYCGAEIKKGDLCNPFAAGVAFMDDLSLACRGSRWACGYCAPLLGAEGLRYSGAGVFSLDDGLIPFRKFAEIAKALEFPPEPPFVAVYATANNQHMAWRAPISMSKEVFYIRVGLRDLRFRRSFALRARDAAEKIAEFMGIPPTKKSLAHPFAVLSRDLKTKDNGIAHGTLRFSATSKTKGRVTLEEARAALPEEFVYLDNLTLGESWGFRFLLSPNAGTESTNETDNE